MEKIYHVAPKNHTGDLISLFSQHGDDAYDIFAKRWPESSSLGQYHAHYVHCYATLDDAVGHLTNHVGDGKIYEINVADLADDYIKVEIDSLEFPHPMVRGEIPGEYLKEISA